MAFRNKNYIDSIASDSVSIIEFEVYDEQGRNLAQAGGSPHRVHANAKGGKAYFAPVPRASVLKAMLDDALPVGDVTFEEDIEVSGGNLSYIHKVVNAREVYFFGNSSETAVDTHVRLRGKLALEQWDPHTGTTRAAECSHATEAGEDVIRVRLTLPAVRSVFLVGPQ